MLKLETVINNLYEKQKNEKKKNILISDLDKTLIFSDREKILRQSEDNICVEYKENKPLSYMSKKAKSILYNLLKNEEFMFIPCTMRSIEQSSRIEFINKDISKYMICYNGCELYIDGILNEEYLTYMNKYLEKELIKQFVEKYTLEYPDLRVLSFKDYYLEIKATTSEEKDIIVEKLKKELDLTKFKIISVTKKIYIMPININKLIAVRYLEENYISGTLYGMGDSIVDEDFVNYCDYSYAPKHSEFRTKGINGYMSKYEKIEGGQDILIQLEKDIQSNS